MHRDTMADPLRKEDRHYPYRDYASWPEGERWELIDGAAYSMSPAPGANHQRVLGEIQGSLLAWLKQRAGGCEVFGAPFDVLLPSDPAQDDDEVDTVVQPDVLVVCEPA